MRRSIRWRLQVWYALVLLGVIGGFTVILFGEARAARIQEVDSELESAALYFDAGLRRFPAHLLDGRGPATADAKRPPTPPAMITPERLLAELTLPPHANPSSGFYFGVWRGDRSLLKANGLPDGAAPPGLTPTTGPTRPRMRFRGEFREAVMSGPQATSILVGRSVQREFASLRRFGLVLGGGAAAALIVGLAGGWAISSRILHPVSAISRTAASISATNLSQRIDVSKVDRELEGLAVVLNSTFDRLESAFERQAQFTADASHELRTPLAVIRSHAELALTRPREAEDYRASLKTILTAAERMTGLVEGLLTLARADAGQLEMHKESVDLAGLVEDALDQFHPLAARKLVTLAADVRPMHIAGDTLRLGQVITNLLGNALQYNRPGGEVRVTLRRDGHDAVLEVTDTGIGIAPRDRPYVFERFFRADKARSRASGGSGLGLAITKSIVEAHGGTISVDSTLGTGSTFRVRLPVE